MNNEQVALETVGGFTTVVVALLFSLDGGALIGAFAGGALYAVKVKELSIPKRLLDMGLSLVVGYFGKDLMFHILGFGDTGLSAFIVAAFFIFTYSLITDNIDFKTLINMLKAWAKSKGL